MIVAITGAQGFIGNYLANYLRLQEEVSVLEIKRETLENINELAKAIIDADVIVHLAGLNRHQDADYLYQQNILLTQNLIQACLQSNTRPHIIFSSSTQEENDNPYGRSKAESQALLSAWADSENAIYSGLVIPNVFGPFGKPEYNSVVATFAHKIAHGETPKILVDSTLKLIYVDELVSHIYKTMVLGESGRIVIPHKYEITVSQLLGTLQTFHERYTSNGEIPSLLDPLEKWLFLTYRCYLPTDTYPIPIKLHIDQRGGFAEIARTLTAGQSSFSYTVPGITRGNHFHTRKFERFAVIRGKALIQLRRIGTSEIISYHLDGDQPAFVDMPIWHTHNITNTGSEELLTLFWINEPYDPNDPDTFFVEV